MIAISDFSPKLFQGAYTVQQASRKANYLFWLAIWLTVVATDLCLCSMLTLQAQRRATTASQAPMAAPMPTPAPTSHPAVPAPVKPEVPDHSMLARLTTYSGEDYYSRKQESASGYTLHAPKGSLGSMVKGTVAVDPRIIPYGSRVIIPHVGVFMAVDTGSAVISRKAARLAASTREESKAIVIDIYCGTQAYANEVENSIPEFTHISWIEPKS